jgi:hypothetical protein
VTGDSSGARTFCSAHWSVNLKQITIKIQIRITNSGWVFVRRVGLEVEGGVAGFGWTRLDWAGPASARDASAGQVGLDGGSGDWVAAGVIVGGFSGISSSSSGWV